MATRTITKVLAGEQDILFGQGTVPQTRNGIVYAIAKVNASVVPYSGDTATGDQVSIKQKFDQSKSGTTAMTINTIVTPVQINLATAPTAVQLTPTTSSAAGVSAYVELVDKDSFNIHHTTAAGTEQFLWTTF